MKKLTSLLSLLLLATICLGQLSTAQVFGDNMVLQRDQPIVIWGKNLPGKKVTVKLGPSSASVRTDKNSSWKVTLEALPAGGPHQLVIKSQNTLTYENVLIGDVWLCSGQSNMEWPLWNTENAEEAIKQANWPQIRHIAVPRNTSLKPSQDINPASWEICTPENAGDFTAVGYYFGRHIHTEAGIPIGLLHSSWGGTHVETWTPLSKLRENEEFTSSVKVLDQSDQIDEMIEKRYAKLKEAVGEIPESDAGNTTGNFEWKDADITSWSDTEVPGLWEGKGLPNFDGVVWFGLDIELTEEEIASNCILNLGPIDDSDRTFINGILVGSMTNQYDENRVYEIDRSILRPGTNRLIVRVDDTGGGGGLWGKAEELSLQTANQTYTLAGTWKRKIGAGSLFTDLGPNDLPTLLYNAMIHPLIDFPIKGVIWYQGESNAGRSKQYASSFPAMIESWRSAWNSPDLPFYFVQLANWQAASEVPQEHGWAELREAQLKTLSLPNTGMAVTIDIGDAEDIHPRNKLDVGKRLALHALKNEYGQSDLVTSGPIYKSHTVDGVKMIITFDHSGSGLEVRDKYGYVKGFAVAGSDRKFYWAKAIVMDNQVVIYSENVPNPVAVRYGWAINPDDLNLYNAEGLPASPFRSDEWPGVTDEVFYEPSLQLED